VLYLTPRAVEQLGCPSNRQGDKMSLDFGQRLRLYFILLVFLVVGVTLASLCGCR